MKGEEEHIGETDLLIHLKKSIMEKMTGCARLRTYWRKLPFFTGEEIQKEDDRLLQMKRSIMEKITDCARLMRSIMEKITDCARLRGTKWRK